ncbi:MAG: thiamine-monophosphate kinase [Candidatus Omnitrophica bacterium]|nr:thiamine-monophosphate kinase [Candidatus Omnitrophota bacterium]
MRIKDIGEIRLIKRAAGDFRLDRSVVKGSGDDTAVIRWVKNKYLLFTCDMSIEDVHFKLGEATPFQIGWKALGRNISDIAAMGGVSRYALVSIGINPDLPVSFLNGICKGMKTLADKFNINIVGGDMARSKKLVIDISLIGDVEKGNLVMRNGAKVGDVILVTGSIGGSIKGKHLNFTPRLNEARKLVKEFKINSMIDISDGLVLDLWRILNASKAGARIYQNTIPLSKDADSFEKAVYEGEDFELLFTMNAKEAKRYFRTALAKMETPVTLIGEIMPRRFGYKLIDKAGRISPLKAKGFLHF